MNPNETIRRAFAPYCKSYSESVLTASAPVTSLNGTAIRAINNDGTHPAVFTLTFCDTAETTMDIEVPASGNVELRPVKLFKQVAKSGSSTDYIVYIGEPA